MVLSGGGLEVEREVDDVGVFEEVLVGLEVEVWGVR